jgi:hypothetical protein
VIVTKEGAMDVLQQYVISNLVRPVEIVLLAVAVLGFINRVVR